MGTKEAKKHSKDKSKKNSDSDSDESSNEHELSYYINDRIKLMQEVLKLIKPKKLTAMAPDSMKNMQSSAVKSLLLEELLGISNKRLLRILAGENLNYDSSSSSESNLDENPNDEVISLDDITDGSEIYISDDNCMEIQLSERERLELEKENPGSAKKTKLKNKKTKDKVAIKKENDKRRKKHKKKASHIKEEPVEGNSEEPVVNVLNLLELQARARAIRSQLANEILTDTTKTNELKTIEEIKLSPKSDNEDSSESVICISPVNPVVTIDSEAENNENGQESSPKKTVNETSDEITDTAQDENIITEDKIISKTEEQSSSVVPHSVDEDYNNDVLIVTEDDITLDKDGDGNDSKKSETNEGDSTWKSRWLDSKKVKDVLKTNKLYNNLRQNRKQKNTNSCSETSVEETVTENVTEPIEINDKLDESEISDDKDKEINTT